MTMQKVTKVIQRDGPGRVAVDLLGAGVLDGNERVRLGAGDTADIGAIDGDTMMGGAVSEDEAVDDKVSPCRASSLEFWDKFGTREELVSYATYKSPRRARAPAA